MNSKQMTISIIFKNYFLIMLYVFMFLYFYIIFMRMHVIGQNCIDNMNYGNSNNCNKKSICKYFFIKLKTTRG